MTKHADLREINNPEACAVAMLKAAISWDPDVRLLGNVRAVDVVAFCAHVIGTCPKCGSEAWCNIDCDLCTVCHSLSYDAEQRPPHAKP